ncbi:hypothetical protein DLAC_05133 [Tieghemostelium lacteum]|uniref:Uncharacterized protein n=1 Tax=Tieghemostelium lacteum TaxID=361077 RepID=A0A151ZIR6_TIELA|nr:hypothetical protein DLAC_05133 [Tieghemostelium lacteum]|eukprot:KYQ93744.1 hypothetical protein DLAC_05133 [Tieghemostelium lacteum]
MYLNSLKQIVRSNQTFRYIFKNGCNNNLVFNRYFTSSSLINSNSSQIFGENNKTLENNDEILQSNKLNIDGEATVEKPFVSQDHSDKMSSLKKLEYYFKKNSEESGNESNSNATRTEKAFQAKIKRVLIGFQSNPLAIFSELEVLLKTEFKLEHMRLIVDCIHWNRKNLTSRLLNRLLVYFIGEKDEEYTQKICTVIKNNNVYSLATYEILLSYYLEKNSLPDIKATIQSLLTSSKIVYSHSIYVPLIDGCLRLGDIESALAFYTRLVQSPLKWNFNAFDMILRYYIQHNQVNQSLKFFYRHLKHTREYIYCSLFPQYLLELKKAGHPEIRSIIEYIQGRKNLMENPVIFYNIIFQFLAESSETVSRLGLKEDAEWLFTFVEGKESNADTYAKSLRYLCTLGHIEKVHNLFQKIINENVFIDYNVYQLLLEFSIMHKDTSLYNATLEYMMLRNHQNSFSCAVLIAYNELRGNKQIVSSLEQILHKKPTYAGSVCLAASQFFLNLNYYELALKWYGLKLQHYQNQPSIRNIISFIIYHHQNVQSNLEQHWLSHLLPDRSTDSIINDNISVASTPEETMGKWKFISSYNPFYTDWKLPEKPLDEELNLAIKDQNCDKIIEALERNYLNKIDLESQDDQKSIEMIPNGTLLLKAYEALCRLDYIKYLYLINKTPKFWRTLVFSPAAYQLLFSKDFDLAVKILSRENTSLMTSHMMYNIVLDSLLNIGQIELAILVAEQMIKKSIKMSVYENFLTTLYDHNKIDHPIIGKLHDILKHMNIQSSTLSNLEIAKLYNEKRYEEAYQLFLVSDKNVETIKLGLDIFAIKFPIPPVSNLMYWGSLIEIEQKTKGRFFFEYFYEVLYRNNLNHIIRLYAEKDDSYHLMTQKEFYYALLAQVDYKKKLEIFMKFPHDTLSPQIINEMKIVNSYIKSPEITKILNNCAVYEPVPKVLNYQPISSESSQFIYNFYLNE